MSKERNDLTLKIFAVIIAIILWSYVMSEVNPEQTEDYRNINVVFNNMEVLEKQGLVLMEPKNVTVKVRVTGTKSDLAKFADMVKSSPNLIKAQVDLAGYSDGQFRVPVDVVLDQSSSIRVERVEPQAILFTFDRLTSKPKAVTIKTTGNLPKDYILGDITTKTQTILLKGPRSWVNEVDEVVAEVELNNRTGNINENLPLKLVDDQGNEVRGVEYEPKVVDVSIPVFKSITVPIELNLENEPPENYEITEVTINPNKIALKGDKNIANLKFIQTKPIDINILMENSEVPVELDIPENVSLLNPNEKVTVSLKIEENFTKTFEYDLGEIDVRNLDNELAIDRDDYSKTIQILVKGNREAIETLTKEDLRLYLDFNMLTEGTHRLYLGFIAPPGITVKEVTPQPIELKIINH